MINARLCCQPIAMAAGPLLLHDAMRAGGTITGDACPTGPEQPACRAGCATLLIRLGGLLWPCRCHNPPHVGCHNPPKNQLVRLVCQTLSICHIVCATECTCIIPQASLMSHGSSAPGNESCLVYLCSRRMIKACRADCATPCILETPTSMLNL
jgi:hypothetical protein